MIGAGNPRFKNVLALVKGRHVQFDLLVGGMKPIERIEDAVRVAEKVDLSWRL